MPAARHDWRSAHGETFSRKAAETIAEALAFKARRPARSYRSIFPSDLLPYFGSTPLPIAGALADLRIVGPGGDEVYDARRVRTHVRSRMPRSGYTCELRPARAREAFAGATSDEQHARILATLDDGGQISCAKIAT